MRNWDDDSYHEKVPFWIVGVFIVVVIMILLSNVEGWP